MAAQEGAVPAESGGGDGAPPGQAQADEAQQGLPESDEPARVASCRATALFPGASGRVAGGAGSPAGSRFLAERGARSIGRRDCSLAVGDRNSTPPGLFALVPPC